MPPPISRSIKHDAIIMGTQGYKQADIAVTLDISIRTVQRAKKKSREYGDVEGGRKKSGPKGKIDQYMEEVYHV
jgi:transposase